MLIAHGEWVALNKVISGIPSLIFVNSRGSVAKTAMAEALHYLLVTAKQKSLSSHTSTINIVHAFQ